MSAQFETLFDCFVISLRRTPERLHVFQQQNSPCGIEFQVFEAVDAAQSDLAEMKRRILADGASGYKSGALGNALSHLKLWEICAAQTKNFVVLEDDAVVRHDVKERLTAAIGQLSEWDIILLGYNTDSPLELSIATGLLLGAAFSIRKPNSQQLAEFAVSTHPVGLHQLHVAMGVCGYAVSPKGAQVLMKNCFPLDNRNVFFSSQNHTFPAYGIDCMMATVYPNIRAYACVAPLVMTANDHSVSTVQE